jgi:hypothetical protein
MWTVLGETSDSVRRFSDLHAHGPAADALFLWPRDETLDCNRSGSISTTSGDERFTAVIRRTKHYFSYMFQPAGAAPGPNPSWTRVGR